MQVVGGLVTIVWAAVLTFAMFWSLEHIPALIGKPQWGGVRADKQAELDGLDVAYHDGFLYPAFLVSGGEGPPTKPVKCWFAREIN
eukprot:1187341-Prorocentrum_minimum.AAC.1